MSAPLWLGWMTEEANSPTKPTTPPSAGWNGPLNLPVVASIDGAELMTVSIATPRPITWVTRLLAICWFDSAGTGVTAFVARLDSRLERPETSEFTSNATTE